MSNFKHYYEALIQAQAGYLVAIYDFASRDPRACCEFFNMKPSDLNSLTCISKGNWSRFVNNLKSWVLVPKFDISDHCLFEYLIVNSHSIEPIVNQVNARIKLGNKLIDENTELSCLSQYQSVMFQNIFLCAQTEPLFTKGLLFLKQSTLDLIDKHYLTSNKIHFIIPILPMFTINKQINYGLFFSADKKAVSNVEQALFSIVA
ncbi:hypothetical protein GCM10009347_43230 [Shewanella algicola]|uniref:Uncharacterized protein n=1 Tax=Shewanella algicola TaxID=640633 RepID=A0A9X1ZAH4_9GAMM|nr:hypothetical protein [Shewanella algicola]MCL1107902.1 hypothetical protein [Shewanella algicola]GGP74778.1 hypothetical protein GCM10009347_43230 [Shewanella algicola]